jgi:hypothetical protein
VKEINVVSDPVTRRSFENPAYLQKVEEKDINTNKDQDINVRISRAGGYLSIQMNVLLLGRLRHLFLSQ